MPESLKPTNRYLATYDHDWRLLAASADFAGEAPSLTDLGVSEVSVEGTPLDVSVGQHTLRGVVLPVPGRSEVLLYAASQRSVDDDIASSAPHEHRPRGRDASSERDARSSAVMRVTAVARPGYRTATRNG